MTAPTPTPTGQRATGRDGLGILLALLAVLLACFHRSLQSGQILFSSDGPLGANAAAYAAMPEAFWGMWQDLNWIGGYVGSAFPDVTCFLLTLLGPFWFAKFYAPLSLGILGLSAWVFFRQLGFRPVVCSLGGLAAALNSDFFSYACWGLGTHVLSVASVFLALAGLVTPATRRVWVKAILAGAAVGMAVMEGFDSGAILSLYVAAFVVFVAWLEPETAARRFLGGLSRTAVVAATAAFVATQALTILIGTQIQGVAGMEQDSTTRAQRWDQATMWSLPKAETLRVIIPGLYGYRMYAFDGSDYWGRVGESPGQPGTRHSGAGHYAGVLVALLGAWALAQSLRRRGSPFSETERRMVWFWGAAALVSLVLAWGRHAPFYQFFYALPYASTIRNPVKFLHPFSLSLVVLFAYGAEALWRTQIARAAVTGATWKDRLRAWWAQGPEFDRRTRLALLGASGAGLVAWLLFAASRRGLEAHLARVMSPPELAPAIAAFSVGEFGWFVLFLALTVGLLMLAFSGFFAGVQARWAGLALGALLVVDLGRANQPWIQYWDFANKYSLNPLLEQLRQEAHQHRVAVLPLQLNREMHELQQIYRADWLQHSFRYYNVQSLDDVQDPRPAADKLAYQRAFFGRQVPGLLRLWELTNTRYVLGVKGLADALNQQADPDRKSFREVLTFGVGMDQVTSAARLETNAAGPLALLEYAAALPRAKLYTQWEVVTNGLAVVERLVDPAFDPQKTVLLATAPELGSLTPSLSRPTGEGARRAGEGAESLTPSPSRPTGEGEAAGNVTVVSYAPKRIVLQATTAAPAVLLLNDNYDPHWTATVNGVARSILRANALMRGIELPAGEHLIELTFRISLLPLGVSLAGLGLTLALLGWVWVERRGEVKSIQDRTSKGSDTARRTNNASL